MDARECSFEALKLQYDHFLRTLDVFETRQTWAFNFAVAVYVLAFSAGGFLFEKALMPALDQRFTPSAATFDMAGFAFVALCSIAAPLLILPLCELFVDVNVYCAGLNSAGIQQFQESFRYFDVSKGEIFNVSQLAFDWLKERDLPIETEANLRCLLFLLAPALGMGVALTVALDLIPAMRPLAPWVRWTAAAGTLVSGACLWITAAGCLKSARARVESKKGWKKAAAAAAPAASPAAPAPPPPAPAKPI